MAKPKSKDELRIVGNGAAERARQKITDRKRRQSSILDQIGAAQKASLGIRKEAKAK